MSFSSEPDYLSSASKTIIIRKARLSDAAQLAETIVSSFYNDLGFFFWLNPVLQYTVSEDLRYRLRHHPPLYQCLTAVSNTTQPETIVGTVEIAIKKSFWLTSNVQYPYISNLAVKAHYRRQGIAKQLLERCEQIATGWGYNRIQLHVLAHNEQAKKLYLGYGYQIVSEEPHWNGFFQPFATRLLLRKQI